MKQVFLLAVLFATPMFAFGQEQKKPDLVLIPRDVAGAALNWIATPDPTMAVRLYSALQACIQDNPNNGTVTHMGPDQCPAVTAGIEAREKELVDAKKPAQEPK